MIQRMEIIFYKIKILCHFEREGEGTKVRGCAMNTDYEESSVIIENQESR